jgi:hypothetical protein
LRAHSGGRAGRFAAGMAATDHNDIESGHGVRLGCGFVAKWGSGVKKNAYVSRETLGQGQSGRVSRETGALRSFKEGQNGGESL